MNRLVALVSDQSTFAYFNEVAKDSNCNFGFIESVEEYTSTDDQTLLLIDISTYYELAKNNIQFLESLSNTVVGVISDQESHLEKIECMKLCNSANHLFFSEPKRMKEELAKIIGLYNKDSSERAVWLPDLKDLNHVELECSEDRWECYKKVQAFTGELECFSSFSSIACSMASELVTNAFYDAPRDEKTGEAKYKDRKVSVQLQRPDVVNFWYGVDNDYFWMIIEDPFGTLDKKTLVKALHRAAKEKAPTLDPTSGGAGLGLYLILESCSEVIFSLSDNKTRVGCKLKITKRNIHFAAEQPSLHIIEA